MPRKEEESDTSVRTSEYAVQAREQALFGRPEPKQKPKRKPEKLDLNGLFEEIAQPLPSGYSAPATPVYKTPGAVTGAYGLSFSTTVEPSTPTPSVTPRTTSFPTQPSSGDDGRLLTPGRSARPLPPQHEVFHQQRAGTPGFSRPPSQGGHAGQRPTTPAPSRGPSWGGGGGEFPIPVPPTLPVPPVGHQQQPIVPPKVPAGKAVTVEDLEKLVKDIQDGKINPPVASAPAPPLPQYSHQDQYPRNPPPPQQPSYYEPQYPAHQPQYPAPPPQYLAPPPQYLAPPPQYSAYLPQHPVHQPQYHNYQAQQPYQSQPYQTQPYQTQPSYQQPHQYQQQPDRRPSYNSYRPTTPALQQPDYQSQQQQPPRLPSHNSYRPTTPGQQQRDHRSQQQQGHRPSHDSYRPKPVKPVYDSRNYATPLERLNNRVSSLGLEPNTNPRSVHEIYEENKHLLYETISGAPHTQFSCKKCTPPERFCEDHDDREIRHAAQRRAAHAEDREKEVEKELEKWHRDTSVSICPHIRIYLSWDTRDPNNEKSSWRLQIRDYTSDGTNYFKPENLKVIVNNHKKCHWRPRDGEEKLYTPSERIDKLVERFDSDAKKDKIRIDLEAAKKGISKLLAAWYIAKFREEERKEEELREKERKERERKERERRDKKRKEKEKEEEARWAAEQNRRARVAAEKARMDNEEKQNRINEIVGNDPKKDAVMAGLAKERERLAKIAKKAKEDALAEELREKDKQDKADVLIPEWKPDSEDDEEAKIIAELFKKQKEEDRQAEEEKQRQAEEEKQRQAEEERKRLAEQQRKQKLLEKQKKKERDEQKELELEAGLEAELDGILGEKPIAKRKRSEDGEEPSAPPTKRKKSQDAVEPSVDNTEVAPPSQAPADTAVTPVLPSNVSQSQGPTSAEVAPVPSPNNEPPVQGPAVLSPKHAEISESPAPESTVAPGDKRKRSPETEDPSAPSPKRHSPSPAASPRTAPKSIASSRSNSQGSQRSILSSGGTRRRGTPSQVRFIPEIEAQEPVQRGRLRSLPAIPIPEELQIGTGAPENTEVEVETQTVTQVQVEVPEEGQDALFNSPADGDFFAEAMAAGIENQNDPNFDEEDGALANLLRTHIDAEEAETAPRPDVDVEDDLKEAVTGIVADDVEGVLQEVVGPEAAAEARSSVYGSARRMSIEDLVDYGYDDDDNDW